MEQSELNIILEEHAKWLKDDSTGKRANLSEANLRYANLSGADLRYANLRDANLSRANLREADISYANLRGANLSRVDLRYANLRDVDLTHASLSSAYIANTMGNGRELKTLLTEFYHVTYTSTQIAIGCEQHAITDWFEFDDKRIKAMDERATEFWTLYKPILITLININKKDQLED